MLEKYTGPVVVTVVYVAVYYAFILNVLRVKNRLKREGGGAFDRYDINNREMLAADRVQLNMLEQMPPFLVLLWLHAVFVSTFSATIVGAVYVASRALYPIVFGSRAQGGAPTRVMPLTFTGYGIIAFLAISLGWFALVPHT